MTRRTPATVALASTPARERFVAAVEGAVAKAAAMNVTPRAVYLTIEDAHALGLKIHFDPPRVMGIEIRPIRGKGKSRLYTKRGIAIAIGGIQEKAK